MIPGYNHNVKYKEKVFHIQTEDSGIKTDGGVKNPHIITLLYYGGNILDSVKSSYAEQSATMDIEAELPSIMQKQHKGVMRGLVKGQYDQRIVERSANAAFLDGPAPLNVARGQNTSSSASTASAVSGDGPAAPPEVDLVAIPVGDNHAATASAHMPAPEQPAVKPAPIAAAPANDGAFSIGGGSMLDAMAAAVPTLDGDKLLDALEHDDDDFVFGENKGDLSSMMLDFLSKG